MTRYAKRVATALFVVAVASHVLAEEGASGDGASHRIPFKDTPSPIEESGLQLGIGVTLLLLAGATALYGGRKRIWQRIGALNTPGRALELEAKIVLSPRCTVYRVISEQRSYLFVVNGDQLLQLDPRQSLLVTATAGEHGAENEG